MRSFPRNIEMRMASLSFEKKHQQKTVELVLYLLNDYLISEQSTKYILIFHWSWQTGNNFGRLGTILNWQSM